MAGPSGAATRSVSEQGGVAMHHICTCGQITGLAFVLFGAVAVMPAAPSSKGKGPPGPPSIDELIQKLKTPDSSIREKAIKALAILGDRAEPALPVLIDAISDGLGNHLGLPPPTEPYTVHSVLFAIGRPAIPALAGAADHHPKIGVPHAAVQILEQMRPDTEAAIPLLQVALRGKAGPEVAGLLFHLDPAGRLVIPAVVPGTKSPLDTLLDDLRHDDPNVRTRAVRGLGSIGTPASKAVPALVRLLTDEEWEVRHAAVETLGEFGPVAVTAMPALRRSLKDASYPVRASAVPALREIAPRDKNVVQELARLLTLQRYAS